MFQGYSSRCVFSKSSKRKLLIFLALSGIYLLYLQVFPVNSDIADNHVSKHQGKKWKVLLVAYMRGGSSFLGELIHRNPDSCYWYEPVDAIYKMLYGFRGSLLPLDIFYYNNGTKRIMPQYEHAYVVERIINILNGRMEELPIMQFVNRMITAFERAVWTAELRNCVRKHKIKNKCDNCKQWHQWHTLKHCYNENIPPWFMNQSSCPQLDSIKCHKTCLDNMETRMKTCLPSINTAKETCGSKTITGIKTLRISMSLVESILEKDPEIKVIHYIRDPRRIMSSQKAAGWRSKIAKKWDRELSFLCDKIKTDYQASEKLKGKFPNSIITVKYEDLARYPIATGQRIYDHIGASFPMDVQEWLRKNARSTDKVLENKINTKPAWKTRQKEKIFREWTRICQEVLDYLDYDLDF